MWGQRVYDWFIMNHCRFACRTRPPGFESHCSQLRHFSTNKLLVSQASCRAFRLKALPKTSIPSLTLCISPEACLLLPAPTSAEMESKEGYLTYLHWSQLEHILSVYPNTPFFISGQSSSSYLVLFPSKFLLPPFKLSPECLA